MENGLVVAGVTGAAGIAGTLAYAIRWALKQKNVMPTTRVVLMFIAGCCVSVAFGVWIVKMFAAMSGMWQNSVSPSIAWFVLAIPGAIALISLIFFGWALHKSHRPEPRDEWAGFILPVVLVLGIGGALGAVGDSIRVGTKDAAVAVTTALVGGKVKSKESRTETREAKSSGRD